MRAVWSTRGKRRGFATGPPSAPSVTDPQISCDEAVISAVNYSEVIAKLVERGGAIVTGNRALEHLHLPVIDFDRGQAVQAGSLRHDIRAAGLSFGDRACLALAKARGLTAITADLAWARLDDAIGITVEVVR